MSATFTDVLAIQCVINAPTGLPRDRVVTRFTVFDAPPGGQGRIDRCEAFVRAFFWGESTLTLSVAGFIPSNYGPLTMRVYDLGVPQPRTPLVKTLTGGTMPATFGGNPTAALPPEIAAVISWRSNVNAPRPGEVGLRALGRNYIGPLTTTALEVTNGRAFLSVPLRTALANAGRRMLAQISLPPVITSEKYGSFHPAIKGWVDNAPDIQRRRGTDATFRTNFDSVNVGGVPV